MARAYVVGNGWLNGVYMHDMIDACCVAPLAGLYDELTYCVGDVVHPPTQARAHDTQHGY